MGEARRVMDAMTDAVFQSDLEAAADLYAPDAVIVTPDQGELRGREQIVEYLKEINDAFPDNSYEPAYKHESGDTAIDEGYFVGTNTAPLSLPTGESAPATGKAVRVRICDIATVQNGVITNHRFYYDQVDLLGQLGLLPETPS
jgi:ketosteroid isomerase-like protein